MSDSLSSFAALFRAVLLLFGEEAPISKVEGVRATARLLKLDPTTFVRVFELRNDGKLPSSDKEANDLFSAYMFQIEQVVVEAPAGPWLGVLLRARVGIRRRSHHRAQPLHVALAPIGVA